jgi:predicted HD phosphohydrolase
LHDVGETLGPLNHGEVVAAILKPFISEQNHWVLAKHPIFQTYFYARHLGLDPNARDQYKDSPYYQACVDFTTNWDEVSFEPDYDSEPLETFVPMVRSVLARPWTPPAAA